MMGRMGQPHPRPNAGKKPLKSCRSNENSENVILIDVDSESSENVIILDSPEPFPKKFRGPSVLRKDKNVAFQNVIHIDDDETPEQQSGAVGNDNGIHADASTSRNSYTAADELQSGKENVIPVRLSKCKRTYSGKASTRNHYGLLDLDSEADETESDSDDNLDCDLMEDISGKVQEQWEKAFFRRKNNLNDHDCGGVGNKASTSQGINVNLDQHRETQGGSRHAMKGSFTSGTNKMSDQNGTSSSRMKDDANFRYSKVFSDPDIYDCSLDALLRDHFRDTKNDSQANDSTFINTKLDENQDCEPGGSRGQMEDRQQNPSAPDSAHQEHSTEAVDRTSHACNDDTIPVAEKTRKSAAPFEDSHHVKASSVEDETTLKKCQNSFQSRVESGIHINKESAKESESLEARSTKESFERSTSPNRTINQNPLPTSSSAESVPGETSCPAKTCLINEREKLKETDEYKRAAEEEWASRQQALQIQAEEAQNLRRLRKRRKAESMRVLDMERRQKQRLEEMRISKKKDEENMNLKEVIRAEVRKDLQRLEISCHDMASLLHSLGISISGWPIPSQQQVQTAYKKALLTFHPDRASRCDIRKQVEAEERFKLVNRLKEKLLPSLLH